MITVEGKEVMVKCSKNHCYKMTDKHAYDIHRFNNSGMYVFEDNYDRDQALMNDKVLDELRSIVNKPITLNHCIQGYCTPTTKGFIKYGKSRSTIALYNSGIVTTTSFVKCSDGVGTGSLKSNMDFCTNADGTGESKSISGVGVLHNNRLYQRTGYNVVGVVISGNYNFGTSVTVCGATSASVCETSEDPGYYVNSDPNTNSDYKLIFCKNDGSVKCENTRVIENGYYWKTGDDGTKVFICDNSGCEVTSTTIAANNCGVSSGINKYKLIYDLSSTFKYCKGGTESGGVAISDLKYYIGNNHYEPKSNFNYPTHFIRGNVPESEILIKTQPYSVTAIIGDNIPIGYVKAGDHYLECGFNEDGKKVCVVADVTSTECTLETVGKLITNGETKLCVDPSIDPVIISSNTGEYLIALGNGKFGIGGRNDGKEYFIGVKVADGNVVVVKGNEKV